MSDIHGGEAESGAERSIHDHDPGGAAEAGDRLRADAMPGKGQFSQSGGASEKGQVSGSATGKAPGDISVSGPAHKK